MGQESLDAIIEFIKHGEKPERSPWDWALIEAVLSDMNVLPVVDFRKTGDVAVGGLETRAEMSRQRQDRGGLHRMGTTHEVIDEALSAGGVVHITYKDNYGNVTERDILPLEWEGPTKVRAWCHLRQAERHFRIDGILACETAEREQGGHADAKGRSRNLSKSRPTRSDSSPAPKHAEINVRRYKARKRRKRHGRSFTKVVKADQWSRLMGYYRECLVRENQQQYVIQNDRGAKFFFNASSEVVHDFLEGRVTLEFDISSQGPRSGVVGFLRQGQDQRGRQLCVGHPVVVVGSGEMAPLVFAPVTVEEGDGKLRLSAEDAQPSYAVFDALGLSQEELATLLEECAGSDRQDEPEVERWEEFLIERLSEVLNRPLEEYDGVGSPRRMALCTRPCLFWANPSIFTRNLINELGELAEEARWGTVPGALKQLLTSVPESTYEDPPALDQDDNIYVTEVNDEQRRTLLALEDRDLVVVTGPPGTGKSQTILNIVAQAVLRGQSVLFASRNNQAVDVVMARLGHEVQFRGALRTGGRRHRRAAAKEMQRTLHYISTAEGNRPISSLRKAYLRLKDEIKDAESTLDRVRELNALLRSQNQERASMRGLLPGPVAELAKEHAPEYHPQEIDHLQQDFSSLLTRAFGCRHKADEIERDVWALVEDNEPQSGILDSLHTFQDQWGAFGGGFLHRTSFDTLESAREYVATWITLLEAFEAQSVVDHRSDLLRRWRSSSLMRPDRFSARLQEEIRSVAANVETQTLSSALEDAKGLAERARDLADGKQRFFERVLALLGLTHPVRHANDRLVSLRKSVALAPGLSSAEVEDASQLFDVCEETASILSASLFQSGLEDARGLLQAARQALGDIVERLPEPLQRDIAKVQVPGSEFDVLEGAFEALLLRIQALVERRDRLASRVNAKLDANEDSLETLAAFKESPAGDDRLLWQLRVPVPLPVIVSHLTKWKHLLSFWEAEAVIHHLEQQLDDLPSERGALATIRELKQIQFQKGADLVTACWLERVKDASTGVLQEAGRYAAAVEQLSTGYNAGTYAQLKSSQEENFSSALTVFPIWATTNLSAKSNLPLESELFDIVVVDEASQCDIPSALPLLYRAKRAVIIGDPNQLKHIATLYEDSDRDSAAAFNVAPDTFLYNQTSLFDLADDSVGSKPGPIMLREHYRSHPSIVEFSNREFYDGQLVVRTDLNRRGIPNTFLKNGCGAFWVDVPGEASRPSGGSAFNQAELRTLQNLLPRLLDSLGQYETAEFVFNVGVVTPFREQANRVEDLVRRRFGESDKVSSGTAHTFQGDERDVIILSTVLGPGLPEGTLRWLNDTDNLLNVAVTRARLQLIVLGNSSYCRKLPPSSIYRRLADHLEGQTVSSYEHLPIFGGEPLDIAGIMIDGTDREAARLTLRRYLTESCHSFVWWLDRYFYDHVLDLFWSVFQQPGVDIHDIRLLTSREQLEASATTGVQFHSEDIKATQGEFKRRGIQLQVRVLPRNQLPHDRYLYSQDQSINMPPFMGAYGDHRHVSEYTRSSTDPSFFEQYWERAQEI